MIALDIQNPCDFDSVPKNNEIQQWVEASIQEKIKSTDLNNGLSLVVRFVDNAEGLDLNQTYRNKNSATNVLSFPFEMPDFHLENLALAEEPIHLGDLVLCQPVVAKEAKQQGKSNQQHWAHLIVHGCLHLQGFDHLNDIDACAMESLEIKILQQLGFENPYNEL